MAYKFVCPQNAVREGGMGVFRAGKKRVLLVWPKGGELKAYRSLCPHDDVPLDKAKFDGEAVICPKHKWRFDCTDGACIKPAGKKGLKAYPLRTSGEGVFVKVGKKK